MNNWTVEHKPDHTVTITDNAGCVRFHGTARITAERLCWALQERDEMAADLDRLRADNSRLRNLLMEWVGTDDPNDEALEENR